MAKDYVKINSPLDLAYDKGNIVMSYKYNHKTFRYNLLKIDQAYFLPKIPALKYDDRFPQDECENAVRGMEAELEDLNKVMKEVYAGLKDKDETIKTKVVRERLLQIRNIVITPKGFVYDFANWIEQFKEKKRKEEIAAGRTPRKMHPTVKDYISALNLIKDYEYDNYARLIQLNDIDDNFIYKLIEYCWEERPDDTAQHKYLTEGGLANNTINKRFDCIFTFIDQFYKVRPNGIGKPKLDTLPRKIIRLNREELSQLEHLAIDDDRLAKVRDYFVFLCYTGLRYSDFCRLDKTFYDAESNELVIKATKTSAECKIYLFDKAKEIAERYNFCFRDYTNQGLNRAIHDLLEKYDLFGEEVTMEFMQEGRRTYTVKKRDLLTCHAGRRSYISIMVEHGMDLYELMSTTGHKKIDTLKFYIDRFGPNRRKRFERINEMLKNEGE